MSLDLIPRRRLRAFPAGAFAAVLLASSVLTACGDDSSAAAPPACGVDGTVVEAVVGSADYEPDETGKIGELDGDPQGAYACSASLDDDKVLVVSAQIQEPGLVKVTRAEIEKSGKNFTHGDGVGLVTGDDGSYVCGQVLTTLRTSGSASPEQGSVERLLKAVADKVGCYESGAG